MQDDEVLTRAVARLPTEPPMVWSVVSQPLDGADATLISPAAGRQAEAPLGGDRLPASGISLSLAIALTVLRSTVRTLRPARRLCTEFWQLGAGFRRDRDVSTNKRIARLSDIGRNRSISVMFRNGLSHDISDVIEELPGISETDGIDLVSGSGSGPVSPRIPISRSVVGIEMWPVSARAR